MESTLQRERQIKRDRECVLKGNVLGLVSWLSALGVFGADGVNR